MCINECANMHVCVNYRKCLAALARAVARAHEGGWGCAIAYMSVGVSMGKSD